MQVQGARQLLQIMIVVAHGGACLQPSRLGLRPPWTQIYLDKFDCAGHSCDWMCNPYCTMRRTEGRNPVLLLHSCTAIFKITCKNSRKSAEFVPFAASCFFLKSFPLCPL